MRDEYDIMFISFILPLSPSFYAEMMEIMANELILTGKFKKAENAFVAAS